MITFIEFLTEKIAFAKARDQDYTVHPDTILFFSEEDIKTYVENGKTHGVQSHAIKHLSEFNPSMVKTEIGNARGILLNFLKTNKLDFCGLYTKNKGFKKLDPLLAITQANDGAIMNTMDMINDKYQNKKKLLPIENSLYKIIRKLEKEYIKEIEFRINNSTDLDKYDSVENVLSAIESSRIIKFNGFSKVAQTYYLDFKTNSIVISTPDFVRTMYVYDMPGQGYKQVINNFMRKMKNVQYDSSYVAQAFRSIK